MTTKDRILLILQEHANKKGYVSDVDSDSLSTDVQASRHDVIKFLSDMKKEGLVGYSIKSKGGGPAGGSMRIYRIRLTKKALSGSHPVGTQLAPGWPSGWAGEEAEESVKVDTEGAVETAKPSEHSTTATPIVATENAAQRPAENTPGLDTQP